MGNTGTAAVAGGLLLVLGAVALLVYWRGGKSSLLAAVVGFTSLAAAVLGAVLWAAGVPQAVFAGSKLDLAEPDAVWKVTQSVTLTFGALGVVAASVITYHRQRTQERQVEAAQKQVAAAQKQLKQDRKKHQLELDRFDQERAKYEQDQVREIERRRQERYAQGAQMLADVSPSVRVAGLNVITALGREVPADNELRQTCINLICAYLRATSPAKPRPEPNDPPAENDESRIVTAEACRLLPTLLELASKDEESPMPHGMDLDLRAVNLIDLDLDRCAVGRATFTGATFTGTASFCNATFTGHALFGGSTFTWAAWFDRATFTETVWFDRATFTEFASFRDAAFTGTAAFFHGATFTGQASFEQVRFVGYSGPEDLAGAKFEKGEPFAGALYGPIPKGGNESGSPG